MGNTLDSPPPPPQKKKRKKDAINDPPGIPTYRSQFPQAFAGWLGWEDGPLGYVGKQPDLLRRQKRKYDHQTWAKFTI